LRLPFRHIGVRPNLTHGFAQTKQFSFLRPTSAVVAKFF